MAEVMTSLKSVFGRVERGAGRTSSLWCRALIAAGLAVSLAGCVTEGKDFASTTDWIRKGETKQGDVIRALGSPHSVGDNNGQTTWTYGYYRYKLIGDSFTKELKFWWRQDGVLSDYSFTSSFPEDVLRVPGKPGRAPQSRSEAAPPPTRSVPAAPAVPASSGYVEESIGQTAPVKGPPARRGVISSRGAANYPQKHTR